MDDPANLPFVYTESEINTKLSTLSQNFAADPQIKYIVGSSMEFLLLNHTPDSNQAYRFGRAKIQISIKIKQYRPNLNEIDLLGLHSYLRQKYNLDVEETELNVDHNAKTGVINITTNLP